MQRLTQAGRDCGLSVTTTISRVLPRSHMMWIYCGGLERIPGGGSCFARHSSSSPQARESDLTSKGISKDFENLMNGGGGIRTHGSGVSGEGETRSADYKSAAIDPSATPPQEPQGTGVPWGNLLAFAFLGMEHERLQPIIGSVDDSAVLERDVRGEYTPICGRRSRNWLCHSFTCLSMV